MSDISDVRQWLSQATNVVALTGAGISAESGVPTFRDSQTGIWAKFDPMELATEEAFRAHPQRVWQWYASRRDMVGRVEPNAGHLALSCFAEQNPGKLTVVTQNVDGLHQRAGQKGVIALHGSLMVDTWLNPAKECCNPDHLTAEEPPACPACGNMRRPGVVWFGENLPRRALERAQQLAEQCDLMLVIGTSGVVYPAAGLARMAANAGASVVVINPESSALDDLAVSCFRGASAIVLPELLALQSS